MDNIFDSFFGTVFGARNRERMIDTDLGLVIAEESPIQSSKPGPTQYRIRPTSSEPVISLNLPRKKVTAEQFEANEAEFKRLVRADGSPVGPLEAKSQAELIVMLHAEFDNAADELLAEAEAVLHKAADEKALRLAKLGFSIAPGVAEQEILKTQKTQAQESAERIEYFKKTYPKYPFVSQERAIVIAKKYGLLLASVEHFIGQVPDENIAEMEAFTIEDKDKRWGGMREHRTEYWGRNEVRWREVSYEDAQEAQSYRAQPFQIVAPLKDFKIDDTMVIENNEVKQYIQHDPIVLQPVRGGGYLVVTAWGPEAEEVR